MLLKAGPTWSLVLTVSTTGDDLAAQIPPRHHLLRAAERERCCAGSQLLPPAPGAGWDPLGAIPCHAHTTCRCLPWVGLLLKQVPPRRACPSAANCQQPRLQAQELAPTSTETAGRPGPRGGQEVTLLSPGWEGRAPSRQLYGQELSPGWGTGSARPACPPRQLPSADRRETTAPTNPVSKARERRRAGWQRRLGGSGLRLWPPRSQLGLGWLRRFCDSEASPQTGSGEVRLIARRSTAHREGRQREALQHSCFASSPGCALPERAPKRQDADTRRSLRGAQGAWGPQPPALAVPRSPAVVAPPVPSTSDWCRGAAGKAWASSSLCSRDTL